MAGGYQLGIDLGTSFSAAAVCRSGRAEVVDLGTRASVVPSALFLGVDGRLLVGEPAVRRGLSEPDRLVREFKRRFGDPVPLIVGGSPLSADVLTARLLGWILDAVGARQGGPPERVALTYPANWGMYKRDLLTGAARMAGLDGAVLVSEPEAAALEYAAAGGVQPGQVVAVYDLGGGTFDAAALRRTDSGPTGSGWELLGQPEGIERLGGVDFDRAVLEHVRSSVGTPMAGLDGEDPAVAAALTRLLGECTAAKEALSEDTEATIAVALPGLQTDVRLTRSEFEDLIRPSLEPTLDVLARVIASAGVQPEELAAVLLVGGSSRIPLVSVLVEQRLGVPAVVDAHPKNTVALGAAGALAQHAPSPEPEPEPAPILITPPRPHPAAFVPPPPVPPAPPYPAADPPIPVVGVPASAGESKRRQRMAILGTAVAAVLLLVAGVLYGPALLSALASQGEVFLEPAHTPGADPFTDDAVIGPRLNLPSLPPTGAASGAIPGVPGDQPALYGGTRNERVCDKDKLVGFLAANPDKANAWAAVLGISPAKIPEYVGGLTSVLLRADTRVINHGYRDSRATPRQSVLQAGTAVLVDELGVPRVKCGCGNPLGEPTASPVEAQYSGQPWAGFDSKALVRVTPAARPIDKFRLIDARSGQPFDRPRGTDGPADLDAVPAAVPEPTPVAPVPAVQVPLAPPVQPAPTNPAPAKPVYHPVVGLDKSSGPVATDIHASGSGFIPGQTVNISESGACGDHALGSTPTDGAGAFGFGLHVTDCGGGARDVTITFRQSAEVAATATFSVTAPPPPPPPTPPAAPTGLTARPDGPNKIVLSWADQSSNETGFEVNNGDTTRSTGANQRALVWTGLEPGSYMCFRVRAVNEAGPSAWVPGGGPGYVCTTTPGGAG